MERNTLNYISCLRIALVVLPGFFSSLQKAQAQDPRFAQIQASPLQLNPSLTGVYRGTYRLSMNYRELYASILGDTPFRTFAAGFDSRIPVSKNDYVGLGFSALRDQAGIGNFNRTSAHLSASIIKQLNGSYRGRGSDQYLVAGVQTGFGQYRVRDTRLWFSNQYDLNQYQIDPTQPSGELFEGLPTRIFPDFNAGLLWYAVFDDRNSLFFGAAANHVNRPDISLTEFLKETLPVRWVVNVGGELPLGKELSLLPSIALMRQGNHLSSTLGSNFRYTSRDWKEIALRAGAWLHTSNQTNSGLRQDALIIGTVLETETLNLGLSYDLTLSNLALANDSRGAFEISIQFIKPEKGRKPKVNCPNF